MAWILEDRRNLSVQQQDQPLLTDQLKQQIADTYFHRYPTRRAVLIPALHLIQHHYNHIPLQALQEVAEFLGIAPAEALDTATFYEEFWLKPKGQYLLQVCRSLSCEICGSKRLTNHLRQKLGIEVGETTPDGRFTLVELECLGSCGTAPVLMINEVLHENLTAESLDGLLASLPKDPADYNETVKSPAA